MPFLFYSIRLRTYLSYASTRFVCNVFVVVDELQNIRPHRVRRVPNARGRCFALHAHRLPNPFLAPPCFIFPFACVHDTAPRLVFTFFLQGELHGFPAGLRGGASVRGGDRFPRTPVRGSRGVGRESPHEGRAHGLLQDQQLSAERAHGDGKPGDFSGKLSAVSIRTPSSDGPVLNQARTHLLRHTILNDSFTCSLLVFRRFFFVFPHCFFFYIFFWILSLC